MSIIYTIILIIASTLLLLMDYFFNVILQIKDADLIYSNTHVIVYALFNFAIQLFVIIPLLKDINNQFVYKYTKIRLTYFQMIQVYFVLTIFICITDFR